jgi:hypothetical protein
MACFFVWDYLRVVKPNVVTTRPSPPHPGVARHLATRLCRICRALPFRHILAATRDYQALHLLEADREISRQYSDMYIPGNHDRRDRKYPEAGKHVVRESPETADGPGVAASEIAESRPASRQS